MVLAAAVVESTKFLAATDRRRLPVHRRWWPQSAPAGSGARVPRRRLEGMPRRKRPGYPLARGRDCKEDDVTAAHTFDVSPLEQSPTDRAGTITP